MLKLFKVITELNDRNDARAITTEVVKADSAEDIAKVFLLERYAHCETDGIDIRITCIPLTVEVYMAPITVYAEYPTLTAITYTGKDRDELRRKISREISSNDPSLFSQANQLKEDAIQIGESVELVSGGCENGVCNIDSTT